MEKAKSPPGGLFSWRRSFFLTMAAGVFELGDRRGGGSGYRIDEADEPRGSFPPRESSPKSDISVKFLSHKANLT